MSNRIDLDRINSRLGGSPGGYRESQSNELEEEGTSLNAGMLATVAALMMAVGAGVFFMPNVSFFSWGGEDEQSSYVSSVDASCGKGWRKDLPNPDQMHCYMTRQLNRLCDPEERKHFLAVVKKYDKDYGVWWREHMKGTMKTIAKVQKNGMQIGLEGAKTTAITRDKNATEEQMMKQFEKMGKIVGDTMEKTPGAEYLMRSKVKMYELEGTFAKLYAKGYLSKDDFGWKTPDFIKNAIALHGNKPVGKPCLDR
jgi:hypothetical protein